MADILDRFQRALDMLWEVFDSLSEKEDERRQEFLSRIEDLNRQWKAALDEEERSSRNEAK